MSASLSISPFQPHHCYCPRASPLRPFSLARRPSRKSERREKALQASCCPRQSYLFSSQSDEPESLAQFEDKPDSLYKSHSFYWLLDPDKFISILRSCSKAKEVKRVHAAFLKLLEDPEVFPCNNLISAYVEFSKLDYARALFDGMYERNVVSWTALLNGYSKTGSGNEFLDLLSEMLHSSVQPNCLTFVCTLNFCSRSLDFELGRQIHASAVKRRQRNFIVDSTLLHFYAQFGDLRSAYRIFDRMRTRDIVSWTTMITACTEHGSADEVFSLFSHMQSCGFIPNEFTVSSILKACARAKSLNIGKQLHGSIVKGVVKGDVYVGSALIDMYVRCGEVEDARLVFDMMANRSTVTWTTMIAGYAQSGLGIEAIRLFQRMKRLRIVTNDLTVVSVLSACGSVSSLSLGMEVHAQMLKTNLYPNSHMLSTLVWVYCKCGEYDYAAKVFESMPKRDVISWTALVSGHTALGNDSEALFFLNKMLEDGIEPNPFTYSSALKACSRLEAVMQGKLIHASISKTCGLENAFVGSALISLYMKCGFTDDACRVFYMMPRHNLVSWKAMVIGHAKNGQCAEALKLMYQMQTAGYHVDDYVLSTVLSTCGGIQWESACRSTCMV